MSEQLVIATPIIEVKRRNPYGLSDLQIDGMVETLKMIGLRNVQLEREIAWVRRGYKELTANQCNQIRELETDAVLENIGRILTLMKAWKEL